MPTPADAIFSRIIRREIPARIEHEDDLCLAFHDVAPQAPVHLLVIPKQPIPSLADVTAADEPLLGHLVAVASHLARKLGLDDGYRLVVNTGRDGGQTVHHLHVHLLGGRGLGWPPG
jgi:histidine triad (HIT) family protein